MPAFFLTLVACALASVAGRDAVRVARLSAALGGGKGLFVAIVVAALATSAAAAWLGGLLAPSLAPDAKRVFLGIALVLAAGELALRRAPPAPREPTRSNGAILLVLGFSMATDAVRFIVLAFAVALGAPALAAAGGALASSAVLTVAALAGGEWERRVARPPLRFVCAALLTLAGAVVVLRALRLIG